MNLKLKVEDIHQDGISEEFDRLTELDLEQLLAEKESFVETACPACGSEKLAHVFDYQGLPYKRCGECELLFISPAPTEQMHLDYVCNSSAMKFWRENMPESMKMSRIPMYEERVEYVENIFKELGVSPTSSLEIGAGNGEFAELLRKKNVINHITVLEPQDLNLDGSDINIIQAGFDALNKVDEKFEAIFAWELIEHLLEPDTFLQLIRKCLKPGAPFVLSTPNEKSTETRILGKHSSNILFDHVRLYNPDAMRRLMERNGFKILHISTPGMLDAEKLHSHYSKHPEDFADHPDLVATLKQGEEKLPELQQELRDSMLSSHMRIVAMIDDEWADDDKAVGQAKNIQEASTSHENETPQNFNEIVLPHAKEEDNEYPTKLMHHILNDIVNITEGKMVDLGGGWGFHAKIASNLGFDVTSVDREPATSGVASATCDFLVDPLPFDDNSIDIIFSKSVIEHFYVKDLPHIMSEVKRVLRPGGAYVLLTPDWEKNMKQFYHIFTHVTPYTKSSLAQCLRMYGFANVMTDNLIQLPETWNNPLMTKLAHLTSKLPLPRNTCKWVRWSQEQFIIGVGYKGNDS